MSINASIKKGVYLCKNSQLFHYFPLAQGKVSYRGVPCKQRKQKNLQHWANSATCPPFLISSETMIKLASFIHIDC